MAEAILNYRGGGNFIAYSAGSKPAKEIHPLALKVLIDAGFDMSGKMPKPMEGYLAEEFFFIITLCDRMREECPVFPGKPILAHWGMPDPTTCEGTEGEQQKCFEQTLNDISERISLFLSLPMEKLDRMALELQVKGIGKTSL
jgi:protein-tyrosine-phosphatase